MMVCMTLKCHLLGMIMLDIYKYGVMFMHRYQMSELKCESVVQLCWVWLVIK